MIPSTELRSAFHRRTIGFDEFAKRYRSELSASEAVTELRDSLPEGRVTLLSAVKDIQHSHIPVLLEALRQP